MIKKIVVSDYVIPFMRTCPEFESSSENDIVGYYNNIPVELQEEIKDKELKKITSKELHSIFSTATWISLSFSFLMEDDICYLDLDDQAFKDMVGF